MTEPTEVFKTELSTILKKELDTQGISLTDFADEVGISYEYARKILNVDAIPMKPVLRGIAIYLDLDYEELLTAATKDQLRKKYGDVPLTEIGVSAEVSSINETWAYLTDEQKKSILTQIKDFLAANFKAEKAAPKGYTKPVAKKKPADKG